MSLFFTIAFWILMGCMIGYLYRTILKYYISQVKKSQKANKALTFIVKNNLGTPDRLFRAGIALVLLLWASLSSWNPMILVACGFTLYEALFRWCGWYALIGKNTCPIDTT